MLVPAKVGWFVMELPSFLIPVLLLYLSGSLDSTGKKLLLFLFCGHYFHRTFIYGNRIKGNPMPFKIVISAFIFCAFNGYLQGYSLIYCTHYDDDWTSEIRFISGVLLFLMGLTINIHSDYILLCLRKSNENIYFIPQGGFFEYVSGANYFGEIVEWFGYALATCTFPAFLFAIFTAINLGFRAHQHHRYYLQKFDDYPKSRKSLIPFII
ncbi:3-oxo-5-alpha-steroid 4-dehydrogenase 2-like [Amblyraja radiata]|uniref:3-oxo-5-alpha-steroid 4-dehydrogenase 2-like n=1 Tax=Amblyraja radiata TaxID=386614 RepID=UPI0014020CB2|nr:3-oxo-5-alpha-steroid 4-dehydrogenase 2-like [Amblyraja radiata]